MFMHHCGETKIPVGDFEHFLEGKEGLAFMKIIPLTRNMAARTALALIIYNVQ